MPQDNWKMMMTDIIGAAKPALVGLNGKMLKSEPDEPEVPIEERARLLPEPSGYRILCAIPEVEEQTAGGVYKADMTKQFEELTTPVLFVVKVGPDAYKDEKRFPSGAYCKEGDFILTRPHAGSRVKIHGREFRLINDDSVEAVVEDPRGISRA
jgi:co-chaperonin GroES (HSP10)